MMQNVVIMEIPIGDDNNISSHVANQCWVSQSGRKLVETYEILVMTEI